MAAALRWDPGWRELRAAGVAMVAVLATFGSAYILEQAAHLRADTVVLAVALAILLGRSARAHDPRERWAAVVLVPGIALAAGGVGWLLVREPTLGDGLFVVAASGAIWLRRFGPAAARAGTIAAMPFVALLTTPVRVVGQSHAVLWFAVIGLLASAWLAIVAAAAERLGVVPPAQHPSTPQPQARIAGAPVRLPASTRMAAQMAVALAASFALGRWLYPGHWPWLVLTAYIVCSGNRGRGDVVHKAVLRVAGAAGGTVIATLIARAIPAGHAVSIGLIFLVLGAALWLRSLSYAFWAGTVTAMLALLYGYFGETASAALGERLGGVLLGAAIGVAASWFVLPVRSHDVLRRRTADALAVAGDFLRRAREGAPPADLIDLACAYRAAVAHLDQIAPALAARRLATRHWVPGPHGIDLILSLRLIAEPLEALAGQSARDPDCLRTGAVAQRLGRAERVVGALRRALRDGPSEEAAAAGPGAGGDDALSGLERALAQVGVSIAAASRPPSPSPSPSGRPPG